MSNVDINVDRRTDGRKIGRLYRTLLQAGAIKTSLLSGIKLFLEDDKLPTFRIHVFQTEDMNAMKKC